MKKYVFSIFTTLLFFHSGYAQIAKPFTLQGKLPSNSSGYVYLYYPITDKTWKNDSSLVKQGNFSFKGNLSLPTVARLSYAKEWTQIILEPSAMNMFIRNGKDLSTIEMKGSKSQNELSELNTSLHKVDRRWQTVMDTLTAVNKRSNAAFQELKGWVLDPYFKEVEEINHRFITKYPSSFASAHILQIFARELSTDTLQLFYNRFPLLVKQSRYGKNIAKQLAERKLGVPGILAPSFSKDDINGKNISLRNLQGGYVLLDFWGSWCVPCRKGNPHLISVYEKYKKFGFEIVGIAADDNTQDAWRKAVKDDKLPWLQILHGNISERYNITSYPTKILIDKQGKIIGRFGEEHEPLDNMLEKIFRSNE